MTGLPRSDFLDAEWAGLRPDDPALLEAIRLYQDDDVLVVNKPSGLLSVPGKGDLTDSLRTRLEALDSRVRLIHRLDRDTSGVMVFGLNPEAQRHISRQFEARQTDKTYQAIVMGTLTGTGQVDVPVRYDPTRPPLHVADRSHPKAALTDWQAVDHVELTGQTVSRVQLHPITGRSHQLRVHMQWLGHPIVGDPLYADAVGQALAPRLYLHAARLAFDHPVTGERLVVERDASFWAAP